MGRKKGSKNKGIKALMVENVDVVPEKRIRPDKKKKYPKAMTIRYDEKQEKEIEIMMRCMEENTMSKAFLRCPEILRQHSEKFQQQEKEIEELRAKLFNLESMAESFNEFNKKLVAFVKNH